MDAQFYADTGGDDDPETKFNEENRDYALEILEKSVPIAGTPAESYLRSRGLTGHATLRYVPHARTGEGALLAPLTAGGEAVGIQLRYLTPDGATSVVEPTRQRFTIQPRKGGVFDLPSAATPIKPTPVLICEGLEDALSLWHVMEATFRVIGIPGISCLPHVAGCAKDFVIVPDGDEPETAATVRPKLQAGIDALILAGATVRVADVQPGQDADGHPSKQDANSILQKEGADALRSLITAAMTQPAAELSVEGKIKRLARLDPVARDKARNELLKEHKADGLRASTIDKIVRAEKPRTEVDRTAKFIAQAEPWHEPVVLAQLLSDLATLIRQHVVMSAEAADLIALWVAHTWVFERFQHTGRLGIGSPEARCGKSTLLSLLLSLCRRAVKADNISAAGTYRIIEATFPISLLIDEADTFLRQNEELRGVINSGYERNGCVIRVTEENDKLVPQMFATFAPAAIAGIKELPATIADRSFPIALQRKEVKDVVVRLRNKAATKARRELARRLARWAADQAQDLPDEPAVPDALGDRQADISIPLFAIAEQAGGDWPDRATTAIDTVFRDADLLGAEPNRLLEDCRAVIPADCREAAMRDDDDDNDKAKIASKDLLAGLLVLEDSPWATCNKGSALTKTQLARALKPYRIVSQTVRFKGGVTCKGYKVKQFVAAWCRYLSPEGGENAVTASRAAENCEKHSSQHPSQCRHMQENEPSQGTTTAATLTKPRVVTDPVTGCDGSCDGICDGKKPSSEAGCDGATADLPPLRREAYTTTTVASPVQTGPKATNGATKGRRTPGNDKACVPPTIQFKARDGSGTWRTIVEADTTRSGERSTGRSTGKQVRFDLDGGPEGSA